MMIGSEPLTDEQWDDDRTRRSADVHGRLARRRLRPAHRRRADGVRRPGRAVPLRLAGRRSLRHRRRRARGAARERSRTCSRCSPTSSFPFHWGGPLAAPRDWHPHVAYDRASGIASAGGYVGDGVATANLAGRTLADLILGRDTRSHPPAVGRAPITPLGARAAALARCPARRPSPRARADHAESSCCAVQPDRRAARVGPALVDRFLGRVDVSGGS